jgi:ABC-type Zn uptake system ZnuABC Zn-binding protein ZnuA
MSPGAEQCDQSRFRWRLIAGAFFVLAVGVAQRAEAQVSVCATVPDLGNLVREIGSDEVTVTVFARGTEDPHFLEARPSFVRVLNQTDLLVQVGMSLEAGWMPLLLRNAQNSRVQAGAAGQLDASRGLKPLEVPRGTVDRSQGDVHPEGSPHYLLDPISGLRVAGLIRDKLSELRPDSARNYRERYDAFAKRLSERLVGEALAKKYGPTDVAKLALLHEHGRLRKYLREQKEEDQLSGWLGAMMPYYGTKVVDDHSLWPYFARRFGLVVIAHLEPKPGVEPTTAHLQAVVRQMETDRVRVVLASPYFNSRHAAFVAGTTGATVVPMAHQVGARPSTDDYLGMVDYNVRQLAAALGQNR